MSKEKTAILHYTAPPVIGGVEGVIQAHADEFDRLGYPLTVIAGRGDAKAFPHNVDFLELPEIDSRHPHIQEMSNALRVGKVPGDFDRWVDRFVTTLSPLFAQFDHLIVHNIFTKQYNLPLTAALFKLLDQGQMPNTIAWVHDIAWTSQNSSRRQMYPGYPWEILKTYRPDITYVTVSHLRQQELAGLFGCDSGLIEVIYNGVDTGTILNLTPEGQTLVDRLNLAASDLIILMPVRVTRLKNIEYAIHVTAELKKHFQNPRLILTGPPDPHNEDSTQYFHQLQKLRSEMKVEDEMRFVYESGPKKDEGYEVNLDIIGDLYRISDLLFMPSHSEGFGMPVLEAGLAGLPVFASHIPAADEIGGNDIQWIDLDSSPAETAAQVAEYIKSSPNARFRQRIRRAYTWETIFTQKIMPLLRAQESVNHR
jgi:mannosylglucosylglycerate synthase